MDLQTTLDSNIPHFPIFLIFSVTSYRPRFWFMGSFRPNWELQGFRYWPGGSNRRNYNGITPLVEFCAYCFKFVGSWHLCLRSCRSSRYWMSLNTHYHSWAWIGMNIHALRILTSKNNHMEHALPEIIPSPFLEHTISNRRLAGIESKRAIIKWNSIWKVAASFLPFPFGPPAFSLFPFGPPSFPFSLVRMTYRLYEVYKVYEDV